MRKNLLIGVLASVMAVSIAVPSSGLLRGNKAYAAVNLTNEYMDKLTLPTSAQYNEKDWKKTTVDYIQYILDEANVYTDSDGTYKIARYSSAQNSKSYFESIGRPSETPGDIWSIPSYIGYGDNARMGEGINVIAAVMSGALAGMDMTAYKCSDGTTRNFVKSVVEYYQAVNGENVVLNGGAGGKTGVTFWYELLPGVLFSVLGTQYASESYYMYDIITESARKWRGAVEGLGGAAANFWHTSYNLSTGVAFDGNWYEPDAAAGMAYLLYSAYSLNKNIIDGGGTAYCSSEELEKFREGAIWCMNYLEKLNVSPFYEVLTFLAPYMAARMNVEQGTNYNTAKMFSWLLDGSSSVRSGWGMITDNWGDKYTEGLMGSLTDGQGYAFAMNTFDAMLGFSPMVKYDARFAKDISKWILCVSQSAQSYYPEQYSNDGKVEDAGSGNTIYHGKYQSGNFISQNSPEASFIAYEGLRRYRKYVVWDNGTRTTAVDKSVTPYASGDAFTYDWGGKTDYGLYGSSHVGLLGGSIEYTNVPMIIKTDLNKLDVYTSSTFSFDMYYNPYEQAKDVEITLTNATDKLYDTISKSYLNVSSSGGKTTFSIPAGATVIACELPQNATVIKNGSTYTCNGQFIAQDRAAVTLNLYSDAEGKNAISPYSSVSGKIYASVKGEIPEGAAISSFSVSFAGTSVYSANAIPSGLIEIDTKNLKNSTGALSATLSLEGGGKETAAITVKVLNVVKTPAVSYESAADMAEKWNAATTDWLSAHPLSDHTGTASYDGDNFVVSVASPKGYGFSSSEQFTVDFSRIPMIEFNVVSVSNLYSVKVYVEGMTAVNNYTGVYLIRDTADTGKVELDILEEIKKEDRSFDLEGAQKISVKISPIGNIGDNVVISDFNVYHMYSTPVVDEPSEYEWTHNFTAVWMSLWNAGESEGAIGDVTMTYTDNGTVEVSGQSGYCGIASPYITTDLGQNPVAEVSLDSLSGKYFVGVRFEGDSTLYIIADGQSAPSGRFEVTKLLNSRYEDGSFKGVARMKIVVGVSGKGTAEFSGVSTYYMLSSWGSVIKDSAWNDWERSTDGTAVGSLELDTSGRAVITNNGLAASDTAVAGMRGKFSVNFDYNPELKITVRGLSTGAKWRVTLSLFDAPQNKVVLYPWSTEKTTIAINLKNVASSFSGLQNVYLGIDVLGGARSVTVSRLETFYTSVQPSFESGAELSEEIATWNKDATNSSIITVENNSVTLSENKAGSKGLFTNEISADTALNPYIVCDVSAVSADCGWYVRAEINGKQYYLTAQKVSATGKTYIDVVSSLASAGLKIDGIFSAKYELGGFGEDFSVTFASVRFAYRLGVPSSVLCNQEKNEITWNAVSGADNYSVTITDKSGKELAFDIVSTNRYSLKTLGLDTGVYKVYVTAKGANALDSKQAVAPFKQGDIESVVLSAPSQIAVSGTEITFVGDDNAESYRYELKDKDENVTLASGNSDKPIIDFSAYINTCNFEIAIISAGDGAVYLDSEAATYTFYADVIEYINAKKFAAMAASDNKAFATYDLSKESATLTVPYTNWGSVSSLETSVNFDNSPVLSVRFGAGCVGGYFFKIMIDGAAYYLADNTFDIHGITADTDVNFDINAILEDRKDGPSQKITGTHSVRIVFGATADGFDGADTPKVVYKYARIIEMKKGSGVKKLGILAMPEVSVSNKIISWNAVENAQAYTVVISNETGVLLSVSTDKTSYDVSILQREGSYSVMVTATSDKYYSSDSGEAAFEITEQSDSSSTLGGGCNSELWQVGIIVLSAALAAACVIVLVKRKARK